MLLVSSVYRYTDWTNSSFCTVFTALRYKMLFFLSVYRYTDYKNSFCTVLGYKMLLVQAVYEYTPWTNSFCTVFAPQNAITLVRISMYGREQ